MFGLEGSGFIIAISVCLLLVGAVVYYFNARVATLEKGLTAQSGILQTFITNVKHQLMTAPPPVNSGGIVNSQQPSEQPENGATLSAVKAAQEWSGKPRSLVPVSDDDNSDDDDVDDDDDSSLNDSDDVESDDEDESDDEGDSDDEQDKVINLGEDITNGALEGLLNVAPIAVMKVDGEDGNTPAVAMVMQALELDGREIVDLTGDDEEKGPQITEIVDIADSKEPGTDDAVNEISLGELDNMESLDNTVDESLKSSSLGSSLDDDDGDGDDATADTNTSIPAGTDFSKMKVATLKGLAKKAKIHGYSSLNKAALVSALKNHASQ